MRLNMPITNVERHLKDGETIVSKTDLKGRILYVNRPFMEISGFTDEELIGGPHNIVRHPDMPAAAFADLWQTLKSGKLWNAMVKNRCKNGDHYWVEANANPIWKGDHIIGFTSVRTKPTRSQVEEADRIYRMFNEGKATGLGVREGHIVRTGVRGRLAAVAQMGLMARLTVLCVLLALGVAAGTWAALPNVQAFWARTTIEIAAATSMAMTACLWWLVRTSVFAPINEAIHLCQSIGGGDLTVASNIKTSRTEIGRLMQVIKVMANNVSSIVADVKLAADRGLY